ncbi:MAG: YheU family protein [Sulfuriflexus sp.]|nr:YheU family protein [Sulfuriflexus sp.]
MLIPYQELQKATLTALIEEFIDREGTDYGELEVSRETMVTQVHQQLSDGKVVICYDDESETCNLVTANKAKQDLSND